MTMITETRPEAAGAPGGADAGAPAEVARAAPAEFAGWLTTVDHQRIGRLYVATSLLVALGALVIGGLLALERIDLDGYDILDSGAVGQLIYLYGFGLAFGAVVPLLLGLACAVVPLQVGAANIAFPRAAALSFWAWLAGVGLLIAAFAMNGGPGGGDVNGVDLFLVALALIAAALLVLAVCLGATIVTLRAPGMFLDEVPTLAWSVLVTAVVLLATLPVLVGLCIFLFVDHRYGSRSVFGGNLGVAGYLQWSIEQPQVFAYALPALGFVADVLPVSARVRQPMRPILLGAIALGGFAGLGAFAAAPFAPGGFDDAPYLALGIAGALAALLVLAIGALALRTGKPRLIAPIVWAVVTALMLLVGGAVGALTGWDGLNVVGTMYQTAQSDYVLLGGLLGGLGALAYWGPKLWGRLLPSGPAMGLAVLGLLGVVLAAFPNVILGFLDQPSDSVAFFANPVFEEPDAGPLLNTLTLVGFGVLALTVAGFGALALRGFTRGDPAGADPWDANTLEWTTTSPPPAGNFEGPLAVTSPEPLLDEKAERTGTATGEAG